MPVRIGSHQGYGRIVFDLPSPIDYRVTQQGQRVLVQFTGDVTIGAARGVPRNVVSISGGAAQAELVVAAGTVLHDWRLDNMVVIDVLDHDAARDSPAPLQTVATKPPPANPARNVPLTPSSTPPPPTPPAAEPSAPQGEAQKTETGQTTT